MYEQRQYLIIPTTELFKVDFLQIEETSIDTVRKSVDNTKTFIKWNGEEPTFISEILNSEGPYNHDEILDILSTEEWNFMETI
jgi:hypothetical protein